MHFRLSFYACHNNFVATVSLGLQADDRRIAESHYKISLTLQYLDQPEDSLKAIKVHQTASLIQ